MPVTQGHVIELAARLFTDSPERAAALAYASLASAAVATLACRISRRTYDGVHAPR